MFFEDEKDNIGNTPDIIISEDDTTSWDILDDENNDDLISIKDTSLEKANEAAANNQEGSSVSSLDFGDELKLIDDSDDSDEVSDDELMKILSEDNSPSKQKAFDAFGNGAAQGDIIEEDFNVDEAVNNADFSQEIEEAQEPEYEETNPQEISQSKEEEQYETDDEVYEDPDFTSTKFQKQKQGVNPLLLALLFATLVALGVYYVTTNYTKDKGVGQKELPVSPDIQQSVDDNQSAETVDDGAYQENIPVVNEENVDTIKPDIPEKKEVINVQSAGRVNPFVPLPKYSPSNDKNYITMTRFDYDASGVMKPPVKYGEKDEFATKLMSISVSGIMYDEIKPSAIITLDDNDYFVQKGDKLDDYKVVDISRNNVKIALGKNIYKANLGEEFKLDSFYGNAGYISTKQGITRQYYSVSDENSQAGSSSGSKRSGSSASPRNRYTSEEDVRIDTYR